MVSNWHQKSESPRFTKLSISMRICGIAKHGMGNRRAARIARACSSSPCNASKTAEHG